MDKVSIFDASFTKPGEGNSDPAGKSPAGLENTPKGDGNVAGNGGTGGTGDDKGDGGTGGTGGVLVVGEHKVDISTLTSDAIEITDENNNPIQLQLDADGNAYDAEGVLRYTAADIASMEAPLTIDSVVQQSKYPIIIDGKPKSYANTLEGYQERESDIAAYVAATTRQTALSSFFDQHPDLYQAYEHKIKTGSIEGFKPAVDYSKLVLDSNNVDQLASIVREGELRAGRSLEMANSYIEYITKENKLFDVAKQYQSNLVQQDQSAIQAREEKRKNDALAEQEANTKFLGVVEDEKGNIKPINAPGSLYDIVVNKRTIGGVTIPAEGVTYIEGGVKKTITPIDIFNTIALSASPEGHTKYQQMLYEANSDPAKMANLAFILLAGSSFKGLVDAKANTVNVVKRLNTQGAGLHSGGTNQNTNTSRKLKPGEKVGFF